MDSVFTTQCDVMYDTNTEVFIRNSSILKSHCYLILLFFFCLNLISNLSLNLKSDISVLRSLGIGTISM